MSPAPAETLARLRPEIERRWKNLLRGAPTLTPLGRPDTLGYLMEATLTQLLAGFQIASEEKWLRACTPIIAPLHAYCACGLGPVRTYFSTGEEALREAALRIPAGESAKLLEWYRLLAQKEIEGVCRACHHQGIPGCCEQAGKG